MAPVSTLASSRSIGDAQYRSENFPYARFNPDIVHPWVLGKWYDDGTPVWVPAIFAYLSLDLEREQLFCQGTSNGLAASTSGDDAADRAVWELIERDAFMTAWLTGSAGRRIHLDETLDEGLAAVVQGIQNLGARVEVYSLPTCVSGSAVLCLALGDGQNFPGVTIGLGADRDPLRALRSAILEVGQTGPYLRRMMQSGFLKTPESPADVREMLQHAAYYFPAHRAAAFDSLRTGMSHPPAPADIRVAVVDVTSTDLRSSPFRVFRAISPDLQPISYGCGLDRMPVARLQRLGLAPKLPEIHPVW
ncbi:MAG: YcaO-like family protein [Acidobacteriota bacterium]